MNMSKHTKPPIESPDDDDFPDEAEQQIQQRRLFTYSLAALQVAKEVDRIYVKHPLFKDALMTCDRIFQLSRELSTAQGGVISGETGTGKTSVVQYFQRSLPQTSLFELGLGALRIRLQHRPTAGQVVGALLRGLKYPFAQVTQQTVYAKRSLAFDVLRQKGTRLVFIDEGQNLATQARHRDREGKETGATDLLREMMDEAQVGLVIISDGSLKSLKTVDPALDSRVAAHVRLADFAKGAMWHAFVRTFCKQSKAFDLSFLDKPGPVDMTHAATGGNPRHFKRLVTEAVLITVDAGQQQLDVATMRLAFERLFGVHCERANPYVA